MKAFTVSCVVILLVFSMLCPSSAPSAVNSSSPLADMGSAPAVSLTNQDGRPFELARLRGKVVLVSFVYTTCGGVCPATTHNLYRVQEALKKAQLWGDRVAFVSITVDPENDAPDVLTRYAQTYGADLQSWHFVTGPPARVREVLGHWDMWAKRNASGVLDHPSRIFLLDPRGHRREIYSLEFLRADDVVQDIKTLLAENPNDRR